MQATSPIEVDFSHEKLPEVPQSGWTTQQLLDELSLYQLPNLARNKQRRTIIEQSKKNNPNTKLTRIVLA